MTAAHSESATTQVVGRSRSLIGMLRWILLGVAGVFYALHFLHLDADFPNNSPWMDWSKYTDEGWYGDAAIRHYLTGHWYWKGDFNPAVALPVWPAIEWVFFGIFGVSTYSARTLTLLVFALTLLVLYWLVDKYTQGHSRNNGPSIAAPLLVLFLCCSPYIYVFERMAILEPLMIALTALAMLCASTLQPLPLGYSSHTQKANALWRWRAALPVLTLGVLIPAMVLTKTTAVFLVPAVAYMVWARAGYRFNTAIRLAWPACVIAPLLWLGYYGLFVRPHYLEDYRYLFSANAYTGIELEPFHTVILNTVEDGVWMGYVLYFAFFAVLALALFWRPRLFSNPLFTALLLWTGGYFAFLAYHNNLQPRYYLVVAVPITALVAIGIDQFREAEGRVRWFARGLATAIVLGIVVPDAVGQIKFALHPEYTFRAAAEGIKKIVLADPTHSHLVLSISGSDLTLMTGLPSIDDDFGTLDLDKRVQQYRPGWYAAWNELDDDKMDALSPLYNAVRVAAFPSMDDPDRNLLILYRLDPKEPTQPARHKRKPTPKPLKTKLGQQPSTNQLVH
jgi:4-amino-4-deoxy-L-arabinose transferase-like glycosyltransferase